MTLKRMLLMASVLAISSILALILMGCGHGSVCSKLTAPVCPDSTLVPCGCFDAVLMRGGIMGGDYDPRDEGIHQAIVLRPDSTVEFYDDTTRTSSSRYTITRVMDGNQNRPVFELRLIGPGDPDAAPRLLVEDADHIWFRMPRVVDDFEFLYVR